MCHRSSPLRIAGSIATFVLLIGPIGQRPALALDPARVPSGAVRTVFEASTGQIWVGTDCALNVVRDGVLTEALGEIGLAQTFFEDRQGDVWVGASVGLIRFRGGRLVNRPADFAPV